MKKALLPLLMLTSFMLAADKQLSEVSKLRLLDSYKSAVILQQNVQATQSALQTNQQALKKAIDDFQALEAKEAKENGLPDGTTFTVDISAGTVTVALPPAKPAPAAPKPEEKAPEKK